MGAPDVRARDHFGGSTDLVGCRLFTVFYFSVRSSRSSAVRSLLLTNLLDDDRFLHNNSQSQG